ncbi:MAG: amino acid ABC transporter permease [Oscillospiraceae bacterium]|nr:amino acid ABC transporter permease [Oscillospiraceae bacterium]
MEILHKMLSWLPQLLDGTRITILMTITSTCAGVILGIFLALGKISRNVVISKLCSAYIFFFRGTPLLMQLYFLYYAVPMFLPALTINSRFLAAFIAYGLNSAAYCAEFIRAAIQSIDHGQFEAAKALGLSYGQTMRMLIIPQSIRRLVPPVGNEFIMMLMDVSLVSIISLGDLTKVTRSINSSAATPLVFIPSMIIYLIITAFFTFVFNRVEAHVAKKE